jgi:Transposase IS200 like
MSRKPRLHVPGAHYHVQLRRNYRQDIFFESADRDRFESILARVIERFAARVHAYCWMTNHVHILVHAAAFGAETGKRGKLCVTLVRRDPGVPARHPENTMTLLINRPDAI